MRRFLIALLFCLPALGLAQPEDRMIVFHTNLGDIKLDLYEKKAPNTAANFLTYVKDGFYDGTVFHRVIPGFVVQGGGFDQSLRRKPTRDPIKNETGNGLKNERGTLSMARTSDPDSATSQFFINLADNEPLDYSRGNPGYAVFARVVEGMDVVDAIADIPTGPAGPFQKDVPQQAVMIESAEVVTEAE